MERVSSWSERVQEPFGLSLVSTYSVPPWILDSIYRPADVVQAACPAVRKSTVQGGGWEDRFSLAMWAYQSRNLCHRKFLVPCRVGDQDTALVLGTYIATDPRVEHYVLRDAAAAQPAPISLPSVNQWREADCTSRSISSFARAREVARRILDIPPPVCLS